jgi:hypothetical protein
LCCAAFGPSCFAREPPAAIPYHEGLRAPIQGEVIFRLPVWQVLALQPAAGVDIIGASPLALRSRVLAPLQVRDVVPDGATYQKFPLTALQAEYAAEPDFTAISTLGSAAKVTAR